MVSRSKHYDEFVGERKGYQVIDCVVCGFRHIPAIPEVEEFAKPYRDDYWWPSSVSSSEFWRSAVWSRGVENYGAPRTAATAPGVNLRGI